MPDYSQTRIQFRRGTSAEWTASTAAGTVLGTGEPGYDTGSGVFKIGDGSKTWSALGSQVKSQPDGIANASGINNIIYMTQAAYNALGSKDANTLYYIV